MDLPTNEIICGDWVEVLKTLPSGLVHCCVTSPPYWGQRNYGVEGQLGLEKTPEEHIEKLVVGFREVRRVLRDDGVMFLNYGDKFNSSATHSGGMSKAARHQYGKCFDNGGYTNQIDKNLKQGDLIGLAWRLALALQADGWYLRSDTVWAKAISFGAHNCPSCGKPLYQNINLGEDLLGDSVNEIINHKKSGSTMPESTNGWRWERHKVKVGGESQKSGGLQSGKSNFASMNKIPLAQWRDCPGCAKCSPNDGLVLRKGSWRPTRAHEYVFLLAKTSSYFCDMEAVREELTTDPAALKARVEAGRKGNSRGDAMSVEAWSKNTNQWEPSGRNLRDVWCINPQAYPDAHYATFPEALVEPCIKVGTSEKGCCPKCGSPWARIVDTKNQRIAGGAHKVPIEQRDREHHRKNQSDREGLTQSDTTTLGWRPTCKCLRDKLLSLGNYIKGEKNEKEVSKVAVAGLAKLKEEYEPVPCVVYDPFMGSGTVPAVAARLGRNYIGSELSPDYIKNQAEYRIAEAETGITKEEQVGGQLPLFVRDPALFAHLCLKDIVEGKDNIVKFKKR